MDQVLDVVNLVVGMAGTLPGSAAGGALAFLAGLWLGYRLDLDKARRVEFNAAALPLRQALVEARQAEPRRCARVSAACLDEIEQRLGRRQRAGLRQAWAEYQAAYAGGLQRDAVGQRFFAGDVAALDGAAARVLRYLAVR